MGFDNQLVRQHTKHQGRFKGQDSYKIQVGFGDGAGACYKIAFKL